MNIYKKNEKTGRYRGRFWDLKSGISAEKVSCVDQIGSLTTIIPNIIARTGRIVLLDTDKCVKCIGVGYKDELTKTADGYFPRKYYWTSYRAINAAPALVEKSVKRKSLRMGDNPFLAIIFYSHWTEQYG